MAACFRIFLEQETYTTTHIQIVSVMVSGKERMKPFKSKYNVELI